MFQKKKFNKKDCPSMDYTLMTNADVPFLATKDLIDSAKNPFTGNLLKVEKKNDFAIIADSPEESTNNRHNKQFKTKKNEWLTVKDSIFESKNWGMLYE